MPTTHDNEPLSVLFVDDEEHILNALRRLFLDEDYTILTAQSGKEGLEVLKNAEVAVIVSDQKMPGMSGAEFLEQAKQLSPDAGRIVLTGHADVAMAIDAINKGGAQRYVAKPWNNDELISAVRWASEGYRLIRENRYLTALTAEQNEQLKQWSAELELHVQQQTIELTFKNRELADLNTKLEKEFRDFIVMVSNLIELRDTSIANHSNNVAAVSTQLARKLKLSDDEVQSIAIAAQLHDIGKIGIPDAILLKDIDSLETFELREYRKHPVRGQAALDSSDIFRSAAVLVRHHHEAYNGSGFPDGLSEKAIPLGSRIITIADTFDRLLPTHVVPKALDQLKSLAGITLDPQLIIPMMEIARERSTDLSRSTQTVEEELHPDVLVPGMVLSRDVRSGTGLLLVSKGVVLNLRRIDSLKRYYRLDPPATGVFLWKKA